jgi:2-(1,2-epoxy-1,2-dihydrophenyl)acetyl-CoA isomerase
LVPHERLVDEAVETASIIASHPDRPLRMMKELLSKNGSDSDLDAVMEREIEYLQECYASDEHKKAVAAFIEKRAPVFVRR